MRLRHFVPISIVLQCAVGAWPAFSDVFTRIADYSTPVPDAPGHFVDFSDTTGNPVMAPAMDGDSVVFTTWFNFAQPALFLWRDGQLSRLADWRTPVPDGTGGFTYLREPSIRGDTIAFNALSNANRLEGNYEMVSGAPVRVVDNNVTAPGGTTPFFGVGVPRVVGQDVVFTGTSSGDAVYRSHAGNLVPLVDQNTLVPGTDRTFAHIGGVATARDGDFAFVGSGPSYSNEGVYASIGGTLVRIADQQSPLGTGMIHHFGAVAFDGTTVWFVASDPSLTSYSLNYAIYTWRAGVIRRVVQTGDVISAGQFPVQLDETSVLSADDGHFAFQDWNGNIYSDIDGGPLRVIAGPHTAVLGKAMRYAALGPDSVSGDRLAFTALLYDLTSGVYMVPEPAALQFLIFSVVFLRRRKRGVPFPAWA